MKYIILLAFLVGCSESKTTITQQPADIVYENEQKQVEDAEAKDEKEEIEDRFIETEDVEIEPEDFINEVVVNRNNNLAPLAWGLEHPDWDKIIYDELAQLPDTQLPSLPCRTLSTKNCAAQLLSIIAKRESNFDTLAKYKETGRLKGLTSRGLLQLSMESGNLYGCNIKNEKELHIPKVNLKCGIKILARWAKRDKTLIAQPKLGCARYWSVCRSKNGTSKSHKVIMSYLSNL